MGRSTVTSKYSPYLIDILDVLKDEPKKVMPVKFYEKKKAKNFQLDFLAFKAAAIRENWHRDYAGVMYYPDLNSLKTRYREEGGFFWIDIYHLKYDADALDLFDQIQAIKRSRETDS